MGYRGGARAFLSVLAIATVAGVPPALAEEQQAPEPERQQGEQEAPASAIVFPVAGAHSFSDTFDAPRSGGRRHRGIDIFADKLTPVVAAADGAIARMEEGPRAGYFLVLRHDDGWSSFYVHLNNDTPGTDDGQGWGYAEGIAEGVRVKAGDVIGFVGDSGNAENSSAHLHFELHTPDGAAVNPYQQLVAAMTPSRRAVTSPGLAPETHNTILVGHLDPGGGFNADLSVFDQTVYLGTWGRTASCPAHGVRVIDVSDPTNPSLVGSFADGSEFPGTSTENLWVGRVVTSAFDGDLAVVGVRVCDNSEQGRAKRTFRGLALYRVSDPESPELLARLSTGKRTQGVLDLAVAQRPDGRILVIATVPQSLLHHPEGKGDLRIVDITDPANPVEVADWDFRRDAPAAVREPLVAERDLEELHAHGVWSAEDGMRLYVSHWDAGLVVLDLTDPASPEFVGNTGHPGDQEGNSHSGWFDPEGLFFVQNDEDLYPNASEEREVGWGYQRIFDVSDPANPVHVASFATENAVPGEDGKVGLAGIYSVHSGEMQGSVEYVAWYSDGLRIVDLQNPANPTEVGYFIPPPAPDPQGYWVAADGSRAFPLVWGVHPDGELVYVSDANSGLWIIRLGSPEPEPTSAPYGRGPA